MSEFKLVINDPKTGKSYQKVVTDDVFTGKKINETIKGDSFGFKGYEFKVRGGSDSAGFPMRQGLDTSARRKPLMSDGSGFNRKKRKKQHTKFHYFLQKRKTVRGQVVGPNITQLNLLITKSGAKKIEELVGAAPEGETPAEGEAPKEEAKPTEEKKEEAPAKEEPKEAKPTEEKKEAPKEEKPEEKKE